MDVTILLIEAVVVYGLVLGAHAMRHRVGLTYFYAIIGSITAIMSWVTDAGVKVDVGGVTFLVGSTVFYTSLLLGVFVVYVFDGPRATRIAIFTVVGISILMPLIALALNLQMALVQHAPAGYLPTPSLRINLASVLTTLMDLIFLAVSWEFLHLRLARIHYGVRAFVALLGVMWLDVILFNTGAFIGHPNYLNILQGTLYSRLIITLFAAPVLVAYLSWENKRENLPMEQRPLLAILHQLSAVREELSVARQELERRKKAEAALKESQRKLERLATIDDMTGLYNRRHFRSLTKKEIAGSQRYKKTLSLLMIDLDHFKSVNDTHGHEAGDKVLVAIADSVRHVIREADIVGRIGGEEFAVLLPSTTMKGALSLAKRMRREAEETRIPIQQKEISITVSIGVACLSPEDSIDDLLKKADQALYLAKDRGRNRVEYCCELSSPQ